MFITDLMGSLKNLSEVMAILAHIVKSGALGRGKNRNLRIIVVYATLISRERRRKVLEKASLSRREASFWLNNLMHSEAFAEIRWWEQFFGKSVYRMTTKEVAAVREEMARDLLKLLLKGNGRPSKQLSGLLYSGPSPTTKNNGGRPPKMSPDRERVWAAEVLGRQLWLYQRIQKIPGGFSDVMKFLVKHPKCVDDVRQDVPDAEAIEDLEKCLCEEDNKPFDPLRLPALKTRYSRARRQLNHLVAKWGVLP